MADAQIHFCASVEPNLPSDVCVHCRNVNAATQDWKSFAVRNISVSIAPWHQIESARSCSTCNKIIAHFTSRSSVQPLQPECMLRLICDRDGDLGISCEKEECPEKFCMPKCTKFCANGSRNGWQAASNIAPHKHGSLFLRHVTPSAIMEPQTVDIAKLQRCLLTCDLHHRDMCRSPAQRSQPLHQTIFINVRTKALSVGRTNARYAALSYVWGKLNNQFQTLRSNYSELQEPGSLMLNWHLLPATVQDAITLTEQLDLTFLWIDRLCIVQDDDTTKEGVSRMASIYLNAYVTIVAASGADAQAGLYGVGNCKTYYRFHQQTFSCVEPEEKEDIWHTRAWTFQERAVARRSIIFFQGTVKFECQEGVYYKESEHAEMLDKPPREAQQEHDEVESYKKILFGMNKSFHPRYNITIVPWPDVSQFRRLLTGFSGRAISKSADSMAAFSAILNIFSPSFPGGFIYAIPEFIFDVGITWHHAKIPGKRRHMFPSWSWLGWEGSSQIGDWDPTARPAHRTLRTPLVRWQKRVSKTHELVSIDNSYHKWERFAVDTSDEPPRQWTRAAAPHNDGMHYTNDLLPQRQLDPYSSPGVRFALYQPVPISQGPPVSNENCWDPLLFGRVTLAKFALGEPLSQSHPLQFNMYDAKQQWAGIMIPSSDNIQEGRCAECSVIAVCRAKRARDESSSQYFEEMAMRSEIAAENPYHFIQVLWVEYEDRVATRRGTGRVRANIWEEQNAQEIDIVLG